MAGRVRGEAGSAVGGQVRQMPAPDIEQICVRKGAACSPVGAACSGKQKHLSPSSCSLAEEHLRTIAWHSKHLRRRLRRQSEWLNLPTGAAATAVADAADAVAAAALGLTSTGLLPRRRSWMASRCSRSCRALSHTSRPESPGYCTQQGKAVGANTSGRRAGSAARRGAEEEWQGAACSTCSTAAPATRRRHLASTHLCRVKLHLEPLDVVREVVLVVVAPLLCTGCWAGMVS